MPKTYDIARTLKGQLVKLGSVSFEGTTPGPLALTGDTADHTALESVWNKTVEKDVLTVAYTRHIENADGQVQAVLMADQVERGSAKYPRAIFEHLAYYFGYLGSEASEQS